MYLFTYSAKHFCALSLLVGTVEVFKREVFYMPMISIVLTVNKAEGMSYWDTFR